MPEPAEIVELHECSVSLRLGENLQNRVRIVACCPSDGPCLLSKETWALASQWSYRNMPCSFGFQVFHAMSAQAVFLDLLWFFFFKAFHFSFGYIPHCSVSLEKVHCRFKSLCKTFVPFTNLKCIWCLRKAAVLYWRCPPAAVKKCKRTNSGPEFFKTKCQHDWYFVFQILQVTYAIKKK